MTFHRPRPLTTRPSVSVVIPCYKYGHFLADAVASVLDQDGVDVDVLIVDDASPDDSAQVAQQLADADPRVRVLVNEVNLRHIRTYNRGLALATGDYVVLMSADDMMPRNAITRAVALMEHHPRVGLVYGHPENFSDRPGEAVDRVRSWSVWGGRSWFARIARTSRNPILSPEVVMRREAWEEVGGYDERLPHASDMWVWLHTALRWDIGRVNGPTQAFYRVHQANMHLNHAEGMMLRDLTERMRVFDVISDEATPLPPNHAALHERARKAVAFEAIRQVRGTAVIDDVVDDPDAFRTLARETWPPITGTRAWAHAGPAHPVVVKAARVRAALLWRLWRRYGL